MESKVCRLTIIALGAIITVLFIGLIALAGDLSRERVGDGTYNFIDAKGLNVTKEAIWTTVGIRGTEWRLVFIRIVEPTNS